MTPKTPPRVTLLHRRGAGGAAAMRKEVAGISSARRAVGMLADVVTRIGR